MFEGGLVVGLDIGSSSLKAAIGEYDHQGKLCLAGHAEIASAGLRKGVIINVEQVVHLIVKVIEEAEQDAGRTVEELWISLSGQSLESMNSRGMVAVNAKDRVIGQIDLKRVLDVAKAIALPMDREILHVIPQHYIVDDQPGVKSPLDMIAVRLGAEVHIVTAPVSASENVLKAVNRSGFRVHSIVMDSLAASYGALTSEEMEMGVMLIDMGSSAFKWIVFQGGAPWKSGCLPYGGDQITKDISIVLKTPLESAEEIKRENGYCWDRLIDQDNPVIVPGVGGRQPIHINESELCEIIHSRMSEMMRMIREDLDLGKNIYRLGGGIVLTGGTARIRGAAELCTTLFDLPVRVGCPLGPDNLSPRLKAPEYAGLMGLIQYGHRFGKEQFGEGKKQKITIGSSEKKEKSGSSTLWNWIKEFV